MEEMHPERANRGTEVEEARPCIQFAADYLCTAARTVTSC